MEATESLMWCCFNIADSRGGLVTLAAYLQGKNKGVRNSKEKVINSNPPNVFMGSIWQRNQGLLHPVLISRRIEYMSWEFEPFHSTTCCFHFLAAVSAAYNQRAEGHPATKARTTSACRIVSAALPDFVFRGVLAVNRETMAAVWPRGSSVRKVPSWCSWWKPDPRVQSTFA